MTPRRATIVDIAEEIGISKSTVANVLNGTGRFSPETAERVHAAAERLGYAINRSARSLRSGRVGSFGLHLPAVARRLPFYAEFAFGAADGADAAHSDLTLFTREVDPARRFAVDGAIVVDPAPDADIVVALSRAGIPLVSVGAYRGIGEAEVSATLDARHDVLQREALTALRRRGRNRFVLLSMRRDLGAAWAEQTEHTFRSWCAEAGVPSVVIDVSAAPATQSATAVLAEVTRHGGDAVVCAGQGLAQLMRVALETSGVRIGEDLDLASFAASPAEMLDGRLTVLDLAPGAYGERAAELLARIVDGDRTALGHHWFEGAAVRVGQP
ncbi:LacI family DNA-binding transcriptional regulator [uncultured Microbacterium sp.]|uniref:LacI family DNA-binding transcriptional regulator n=1 Tax=uncultured Microbacterium sp. TaxID=191216 RepID=UPI0025E173FC|nr:LacI family DNA-binding transcriptional regulator [uncultured Microbacterium sp.]